MKHEGSSSFVHLYVTQIGERLNNIAKEVLPSSNWLVDTNLKGIYPSISCHLLGINEEDLIIKLEITCDTWEYAAKCFEITMDTEGILSITRDKTPWVSTELSSLTKDNIQQNLDYIKERYLFNDYAGLCDILPL